MEKKQLLKKTRTQGKVNRPFVRRELVSGSASSPSMNRREFISMAGGATVTAIGAGAALPSLLGAKTPQACDIGPLPGNRRAVEAFQIRTDAARSEFKIPLPNHPCNGDENLYPTKIGNYSKGLPHNSYGEVDPGAYRSLIHALETGRPSDFENIVLGGNVKLVNPQAGLAFDLEGADSHKLFMPPAPALASAQRAGEAVEDYWMALLRDVPFWQYETHPLAQAAIAELNDLSDFRGPKDQNTHQVTVDTLFRGFTAGDLIGPYVSQFLLQPFDFGAIHIDQILRTVLPADAGGADYMTDFASWLAVQNGQGPFRPNLFDPKRRYIRCGRDLCAYVHVDVLFEAYFNACLVLIDMGAPFNPGNPYNHSKTQQGFGTFGPPHIKTLMAEVSTRALKAAWYQKWFVHRILRPEAYGGLVHNTLANIRRYPLHPDVLNSQVVQECFSRNGSYLLPHAFPEGCPQHPSYGEGHATVAGACVTLLKALFDETFIIPNPMEASDDGLSLIPYLGEDQGQLTVGGEANKLAANIGLGRDHAAVHWRSDYQEAVLLGEAVAISLLRDQRETYNEQFAGFTFTKFDGKTITV
jgi:hypothetical protein